MLPARSIRKTISPSPGYRPCRSPHSSCNCCSVSALLLQRSCYHLCRCTCVAIAVTSTLSHPHIPLTIKMCLAVTQNFNGCNCTIARYLICEDRTYTCVLELLLYFFSWQRYAPVSQYQIPRHCCLDSTVSLSQYPTSTPFYLNYFFFFILIFTSSNETPLYNVQRSPYSAYNY